MTAEVLLAATMQVAQRAAAEAMLDDDDEETKRKKQPTHQPNGSRRSLALSPPNSCRTPHSLCFIARC